MTTWRERFMRGEVEVESIDDAVKAWHLDTYTELTLPDALGLTALEFVFFVQYKPAFMRAISREREALR